MKNKKVLLIARFSVQNFKVSVELWKSYIVQRKFEKSSKLVKKIYFFNLTWNLLPISFAHSGFKTTHCDTISNASLTSGTNFNRYPWGDSIFLVSNPWRVKYILIIEDEATLLIKQPINWFALESKNWSVFSLSTYRPGKKWKHIIFIIFDYIREKKNYVRKSWFGIFFCARFTREKISPQKIYFSREYFRTENKII